jgi:hypothetical protein
MVVDATFGERTPGALESALRGAVAMGGMGAGHLAGEVRGRHELL